MAEEGDDAARAALAPRTPGEASDDSDLAAFASSLLADEDSDTQLPDTALDAADLEAVHAAIHEHDRQEAALQEKQRTEPPPPTDAASTEEMQAPPPPVALQHRETELPTAAEPEVVRLLVWFRRDLRLHDNLALHAALEEKRRSEAQGRRVVFVPLYIAHRPQIMLCGVNRFQFMLESVSDLADALAARGSRLVVARGDGLQVLRRLLPAWGITHLFFDAASEPFAIQRDIRAKTLAEDLGVHVHVTHGYTLYDLDAVIASNDGKPPKTYTAFLRAVTLLPTPAKPLATPETVPGLECLPSELYQQVLEYFNARASSGQTEEIKQEEVKEEGESEAERDARQLAELAGPEQLFAIPGASEFGFDVPDHHSFIYGGEQIALGILQEYCRNEGRVVKFEKPKTSPAQTRPSNSTTSLSPYLYFGCISPRTFLHRVRTIQERNAKASSAPPVSLDGQLLWREFFHCHGRANPYFDKMEESPTCLQIDWRWHTIPEREEDLTADDKLARSQFEAWKEGQTGFPWIDAIMKQLKEEGWMHHLARHSVACFLTRGDLYISWVRGLEVFQERLIDHDWSINAGNWLWLSSSYFFSAYFRVYSPSTFGKKWDPEGLFIRKYLPVLSKMPVKYIYEPWKAPVTVQRAAGCLVGKDYPFPIVDHKIAMRRCMAGMKESYAAGQYGVPPAAKPPTSPRNKRAREDSETSDDSQSA